ncbi:MAG: bifunctional homocysteine S-methyltransferase/methylenetetrahydrofolate reductase [Myxococcales bacterium]|nr:bifunctional homocysteine S-methyltransferase/methylenetetrahydrofolate reductase [Myxococcales bacterium]
MRRQGRHLRRQDGRGLQTDVGRDHVLFGLCAGQVGRQAAPDAGRPVGAGRQGQGHGQVRGRLRLPGLAQGARGRQVRQRAGSGSFFRPAARDLWAADQLRTLLDERVIVLDGAMGTQLYDAGFSYERAFDGLNLSHPQVVRRVHRDYVDAGAHIVTTNTFGANRLRLQRTHLGEQVAAINAAGVRLAREAVHARPPHNRPLVGASVGPLGQPLAPIGRLTRELAAEAFREQLQALADADPDLFLLETFSDLDELRLCAHVLAEVAPGVAFLAFATFTEEGKTIYGHKPEEIARGLLAEGAAAVGANCSTGPQALDTVVERMGRVPHARLALSPNAGLPRLVDGRYVYVASPDYFAEWAVRMADAGVRAIGGCCGTGPGHVAKMVTAVGVRSPQVRVVANEALPEARDTDAPVPQASGRVGSDFERKLAAGAFVVSVELDPPRGIDCERLIHGAVALRQAGVDAINIADSPLATARMSPLALAVLIRQQVDIEILLHMSCRDRNLLGLLGESMGSHALGVRHLLCVTGDPPSVGDYPGTRGVFEVDSIGLLATLARLNRGQDANGKALNYRTDFRLSCAVNPTAPDLDREVERFHRKVDAGATYALTQPLYDPVDLERFIERARPPIPILVGVLPLRNARHAHFIHHEVPGMAIPLSIRERMRQAGERGPDEGVAIGREFLAAVKPLVAGTYLMPPFNKFEMAIEMLAD